MQAYAWAGMLVNYSKTDGFLQGAKDTFSGEKPCELCCKIAKAKQNDPEGERKNAPLPAPSAGKLLQEFVPSEIVSLASPRFSVFPQADFTGVLPPRDSSVAVPPVPPPRRMA